MKKNYFSRLFAAFAFVAVLVLSGCVQPDEASVYGTWESSAGDGYVITETSIKYDDGGYGYGWEGTIAQVTDSYIYYTIATKYFAISYTNLTDESCKFSNAYKANGKLFTDTLESAIEEFTVDNGYYSYYGEYVKAE